MHKTLRLFLTFAIFIGFASPIYSQNLQSEEAIEVEYYELINEINEHLTIKEGSYSYDYDYVKELVYNFDITSANEHLGGDWTHDSLLIEMINNIEGTSQISDYTDNDNLMLASTCQVNSVNTYWNYSRVWANQSKSTSLSNLYIRSSNLSGSVSTISSFLAEGFRVAGLAGYAATADVVSVVAGYNSSHRSSLGNSIKNNNWSCGTIHEVDLFFAHVWKVEAQGIR